MNTLIRDRAARDRILQVALWTALAGALLLVIASCAVDHSNVTPTQDATLTQLEQERDAAQAAGDPVALATAEAKLDAFDEAVMKERAGPLLGALTAVPGVGPISMVLAPLILAGLPLLSKRGRSHVKNALKGVAPIGSSIAKAYGLQHSTPQSAVAAQLSPVPPNG